MVSTDSPSDRSTKGTTCDPTRFLTHEVLSSHVGYEVCPSGPSPYDWGSLQGPGVRGVWELVWGHREGLAPESGSSRRVPRRGHPQTRRGPTPGKGEGGRTSRVSVLSTLGSFPALSCPVPGVGVEIEWPTTTDGSEGTYPLPPDTLSRLRASPPSALGDGPGNSHRSLYHSSREGRQGGPAGSETLTSHDSGVRVSKLETEERRGDFGPGSPPEDSGETGSGTPGTRTLFWFL